MKKLLLLLTVVLFASCSPDDDKSGFQVVGFAYEEVLENSNDYVFVVSVKNYEPKKYGGAFLVFGKYEDGTNFEIQKNHSQHGAYWIEANEQKEFSFFLNTEKKIQKVDKVDFKMTHQGF